LLFCFVPKLVHIKTSNIAAIHVIIESEAKIFFIVKRTSF
jgi:hypothetical protein